MPCLSTVTCPQPPFAFHNILHIQDLPTSKDGIKKKKNKPKENTKIPTWARFERALPKEQDFESCALDHSATTPLTKISEIAVYTGMGH